MTGAVLILRPQPGADETAERARTRGLEPVTAPLFTIRPVDWTPPPTDRFEAVLFTSANAPRQAGPALASFAHLPCYAVGEATALAAHQAGFVTVRTGPSDAAAVATMMARDGIARALHLSATETAPFAHPDVQIDRVPVYAAHAAERLSDVAVAAIHAGAIVLLHSPRAAAVFADLIGDRRAITRIAAISPAAAEAAGTGWAAAAVADEPRDEALLGAAQQLTASTAESGTAEEIAVPVVPHVQPPRRRAWLWQAGAYASAFLLGGFALAWLLLRWDGAGQFLGIVPPPEPPAAAAPQPQATAPRPIVPVSADPDIARRVAALEQRLSDVGTDTQAAVGNADRAEGLLVALAARRALERGVGLGYLEGLLRQRFGDTQPRAVATIIAFSRQPVTLQQLKSAFEDLGPTLTGVPPDQGFWDALRAEIANLVVIRREGTPSTDPRERLERAKGRLEAGQVEEALREVERMPGRDNGRLWIEAAQRYVAARQALDTIELAALVEPRMPPPVTRPTVQAGTTPAPAPQPEPQMQTR